MVTARKLLGPDSVEAASLIFPGLKDCDERPYIDAVQALTGGPAITVPFRPAGLDVLFRWTERFLDLPDSPNGTMLYCLLEELRARGHCVLLDGNGGDAWLTGSSYQTFDCLRGLAFRRLWHLLFDRPGTPRSQMGGSPAMVSSRFCLGPHVLNYHLLNFFKEAVKGVRISRSRPWRKNDNCHVEQRNDSLVRAYLGYDRLDSVVQALAANQLYDQMWLYYNFFQPVLHISEKILVVADGQRPHVKRRYDTASTPFDRLCQVKGLPAERQQQLEQLRQQTNPAACAPTGAHAP